MSFPVGDCTAICGGDRDPHLLFPGECSSYNMLLVEGTGVCGLGDNVNVCPASDASEKL